MNKRLGLVALLALSFSAWAGSGCSCAGPTPITQPVNSPQTSGSKVHCQCTLTVSGLVVSKTGIMSPRTDDVFACLPNDYGPNGTKGDENAFCSTEVTPWYQILSEQVGLAELNGNPSQAVCGGAYFGMDLPQLDSVSCQAVPLPDGELSDREPMCLTQAGVGLTCGSTVCSLTTDPTFPNGANCLIQGTNPNFSVDLSQCMCTIPNAAQCDNEATTPICTLPPGAGDPQPLTTSPMTAVASRVKTANIEHAASDANVSISVQVFCLPIVGCITATGSADPHVSGTLELYGGPCPGDSCNVQLEGVLFVDAFTITTSDPTGIFSETDTITGTIVKLSVPNALIAVAPDGSAMIPSGELLFDAIGTRNGQVVEQTGSNDHDTPVQIDWASGTIQVVNLQEPIDQSNGTLNLTATFGQSLVNSLSSVANFDFDQDGVPDSVDNCVLVPNPTQVLVPPAFGPAPALTLTACSPGAPVTIPTPPVTDACDKVVNIVGEAISVDGHPISPAIPITASGPIVVEPPFNQNGLPTPPTPVLNGQAVLPSGTVEIQWTATDTNGATTTITEVVKSSTVPTLYATGTLNVDDGTVVETSTGAPAFVVSSGSGTTNFGVSAKTGSLLSLGPVFLSNNALVHGSLETGGLLTTQAGAMVTGSTTQHDTGIVFAPTPAVAATFPSPTPPGVDLEPMHTTSIAPGAFGAVAVKTGSTLTLASGTYTFASLDLEPEATLKINSTGGTVRVFVQSSVIFRGAVIDTGDPSAPDFLLGYLGTQLLDVGSPYNGALFAPNASLILDTVSPGFTGQFFAADIEVRANTTVTHRAFHCAQ